jgi:hypothetical protein
MFLSFRVLRPSVQGLRIRIGTLSAARTFKVPLLLRLGGQVAAGTARWRDYRRISARRGRLPDLRVNMYWRANHTAGAREFVAQIFLSNLALSVHFAAFPNRDLHARFRAFRIYLLSLGRDRRFR